MRDLKRNQQTVYYQLCVPNSVTDKNGNKINGYPGTPIKSRFSVSPNTGEASMQPFGRDVDYDCEMVTHDMSIAIDEYSRLWINAVPEEQPYNYIVKKVARSLNCIRYALKQVTTSRYEN